MPLSVRIICYAISFFLPIVGVILGIVLLNNFQYSSRKVGGNCLIAALSGLIFFIAIGVLSFFNTPST